MNIQSETEPNSLRQITVQKRECIIIIIIIIEIVHGVHI